MPSPSTDLVPLDLIERRILIIRGQKVMLDADLAKLYEVPTSALNQAVHRNIERFPPDFMFQLSPEEFEIWKSQSVTSNPALKMALRKRPWAFTEQGVAMLSSVLKSKRAALVNVAIMRAFVRLRQILATHKDLADRVAAMEHTYDHKVEIVFEILDQLMEPPPTGPKHQIGFVPSAEKEPAA